MHIDHSGNVICAIYTDFRDPLDRQPVGTLIKGCRRQHAIEKSGQILLSKPSRFRDFGENLVRDAGEAHASRSEVTDEVLDDPHDLEDAKRHARALTRASELSGFTVTHNTVSTRRTHTDTHSVSSGTNGWIFCASIEPTDQNGMTRWRSTLESDYDHVSYIHSPRDFARALAAMAADQVGPQGNPSPMTHTFNGGQTLRTTHKSQFIFHGPVIYVDDVYTLVDEPQSPEERMLLHLFVKESRFRHQREYRFVVWTESEPANETQLLDATPALIATMQEHMRRRGPQILPDLDAQKTRGRQAQTNPRSTDLSGYDDESDDATSFNRSEGRGSQIQMPRSLRELASDPSIVTKPNSLDATNLPEDFQALTSTYSAINTLRNKIDGPLGVAKMQPERKQEIASAAWYAERNIRELCQTFPDPISGISISHDNYIVVGVVLRQHPEVECTLAVAPSGEAVMRLAALDRMTSITLENHWMRDHNGKTVQDFVNKMASEAGNRE